MADLADVNRVLGHLRKHYAYAVKNRGSDDLRKEVEDWMPYMADLDPVIMHAAAVQWIGDANEWFPRAGQLREKVLELAALAENKPGWLEAWGVMIDCAGRIGHDVTEERRQKWLQRAYAVNGWTGLDILTAQIKALKWRNICLCDEDQLNTLRAQFRQGYENYQRRATEVSKLLPQVQRLVDHWSIQMRPSLPPAEEERLVLNPNDKQLRLGPPASLPEAPPRELLRRRVQERMPTVREQDRDAQLERLRGQAERLQSQLVGELSERERYAKEVQLAGLIRTLKTHGIYMDSPTPMTTPQTHSLQGETHDGR